MIAAHLTNIGFKIPRAQMRDSIHRVDPDGFNSFIFLFYLLVTILLLKVLNSVNIDQFNDAFTMLLALIIYGTLMAIINLLDME